MMALPYEARASTCPASRAASPSLVDSATGVMSDHFRPAFSRDFEEEQVRGGVLHVGDLLALEVGDGLDRTAGRHHHLLQQGRALADSDGLQRSDAPALRCEDRWDFAGVRQVDRTGSQRLQLQIAALENAVGDLVRGVGQTGLLQ